MPSPFPGMDPYLEARWDTVHPLMTTAVTSLLNEVLPADLEARIDQQVRVESVVDGPRSGQPTRYRPDVSVVTLPSAPAVPVPGGAAMADPREIRIGYDRLPRTSRSIIVVDTADGDRLVTGVEVLSPSNKRAGRRNREYRRKLRRFEAAGVSWVELDLLRSSRRLLTVPWSAIPRGSRASYLAVTYRSADESLRARPMAVREPLPLLAVPVRGGEPPVTIDLQRAFTRAYADGSFRSVDYARPTRRWRTPTRRGPRGCWPGDGKPHTSAARRTRSATARGASRWTKCPTSGTSWRW